MAEIIVTSGRITAKGIEIIAKGQKATSQINRIISFLQMRKSFPKSSHQKAFQPSSI
jgi:hypothetical protein